MNAVISSGPESYLYDKYVIIDFNYRSKLKQKWK